MSLNRKKKYWIKYLDLEPHPEGGYFSESFESQEELIAKDGTARQSYSAKYYMVTRDSFSAFHRLKADEIWHYYDGAPLVFYLIHEDGQLEKKYLGPGEENTIFQTLIPQNTWFAASVKKGDYTLCGCTMSPGFTYEDLEIGSRDILKKQFPEHTGLIDRFARR